MHGTDSRAGKPVVYTVIPKHLVYANLTIGAYVENQGYAVTTPWQYTYGMAGQVDYEELKTSLNTHAVRADQLWVFAEHEGFVPSLEDDVHFGLGLTDGCVREIELFEDANGQRGDPPFADQVRYFHFDAEDMEIEPVHPPFAPPRPEHIEPETGPSSTGGGR